MSKFLTAPQWYDAGGGLNKSLDVNCNGSVTATAFGERAIAGSQCVAIGWKSIAANLSVSVGHEANSTEAGGVAIGHFAKANSGFDCIAIGHGAECAQTSKPNRQIQFLNRDYVPTASEIGFGRDSLLDLIYPIGSIYISVSSYNPGTIFGGNWEEFATGKTLVGVDPADTDFNAANKPGGEKTVTLTKDQIPAHQHSLSKQGAGTQQAEHPVFASVTNVSYGIAGVTNTGGGQPHNNMPPYITVYMWKRTA